jgi:hypothetical protein
MNYFCVQCAQMKSLLHVLFSDTLVGNYINSTSSPLSFSKLCLAKLYLLNAMFGHSKNDSRSQFCHWPTGSLILGRYSYLFRPGPNKLE